MKKTLTIFFLFFTIFINGESPKRIVSLAPNTTEILFALNLKPYIIADTVFCNFPEDAKKIKHIGGFSSVALETLFEEVPDLIVTVEGAQRADVILAIERAHLNLKVYKIINIKNIYEMIISIGKLTGHNEEAVGIISRIKANFADAERLSKNRIVNGIYLLSLDPPIVVGSNSFINEVMQVSGVQNVFRKEKTQYPQIDLECLFSSDVQVILIPSDQKSMREDLLKRIPALKGSISIKIIDADTTLRPSPRIGLGAIDIAKKVWTYK